MVVFDLVIVVKIETRERGVAFAQRGHKGRSASGGQLTVTEVETRERLVPPQRLCERLCTVIGYVIGMNNNFPQREVRLQRLAQRTRSSIADAAKTQEQTPRVSCLS